MRRSSVFGRPPGAERGPETRQPECREAEDRGQLVHERPDEQRGGYDGVDLQAPPAERSSGDVSRRGSEVYGTPTPHVASGGRLAPSMPERG